MKLRDILELLNTGKFICPITNESAFNFLSTTGGLDKVNAAMAPFEREIAQLVDNGAFYLVSNNLSNKSDKLSVRKHFEECRDLIEPVVSFMVLISRVKPETGILSAGNILRYTELLSVVTSNELHISQLNQLMTLKLFRTNKQGTDEKLKAIFKGMVDIGFMIEKNSVEMIFQVTGKVDYFTQIMQFIADHESIDIVEGADDQSELAL
jgi:hypothetical protein